LVKGFLQADFRRFGEVLSVIGDDHEALRAYVWLLALARDGNLSGKEATLARRAGFRGALELRAVLNRLATMRWHNQVLISLDNGPKGVSIIRVKELPGIIIRRAGPGARKDASSEFASGDFEPEPPFADEESLEKALESEPLEASPQAEVYEPWHEPESGGGADAPDDRILSAIANLGAKSPRAVERMRSFLSTLAFAEPGGALPAKVEYSLWTVANEIIAGFDASGAGGLSGEEILLNAILVAEATSDLEIKSAGKFLLACAKRSASEGEAQGAWRRPGAKLPPRPAERPTDGSPAKPPDDGLRVHSSSISDDF